MYHLWMNGSAREGMEIRGERGSEGGILGDMKGRRVGRKGFA